MFICLLSTVYGVSMKNNYRILDAHCHIYPERVAAKAVDMTKGFYETPAAGTGTVSNLLLMGETAGTDAYIVQSVASTPHHVASINHFIAAAVEADRAEGQARLTGLGTIHPDTEDKRAAIEEIVSLGLNGVKLHPDMQKFAIDDPRAYEIYGLCIEHGLPILMHMGDPRYDFSHPDRLHRVLMDLPELRVVGAHMGGWDNWDYACERLSGHTNLYVDSSSSIAAAGKYHGLVPEIVYLDHDHAARLIRAWGADKVLYGTDYPLWSPAADIEAFFDLGLSESENRAILWENARRVFHIG